MWPFRKKRYSLIDSGLLQGMTDCHSHILPGVDDGIQSEEESLQTLHSLYELGIRKFWLTPHIMEDIPNKPADLRDRFEALKEKISEPGIRNSVHLAAEHMIDSLFVRRLAENDVMPFQPDKLRTPLILVETSYFNPPVRLWELLEDIRRKGYIPLLAHPERYVYMNKLDYQRLTDMGVLLQLNVLSLAGAYGEGARRNALQLLHSDSYSYVGTDLHDLDDFLDYAYDDCLTKNDIEALKTIIDNNERGDSD
jgi:tyrosine-protein phosphatase YwqE